MWRRFAGCRPIGSTTAGCMRSSGRCWRVRTTGSWPAARTRRPRWRAFAGSRPTGSSRLPISWRSRLISGAARGRRGPRRVVPGVRACALTMPAAVDRDADRHAFYQYLFFGQWERLRAYAASRGVGIIGDAPIFVALDSVDTWQNRAVFRLDAHGQPLAVAGVPPDYFSAAGQLWGNPLYDWEYLERTDYAWWIDRLRAAFELYDIIRLDHFRGFDTYWEIPTGAPDARVGQWRNGPGLPFFEAVPQGASPGAHHCRGPRLHRARRGGAAPRRRAARHEDPAVRLRPRCQQRQPPAFLHARQRRLHRDARQQHRARLARRACRRPTRA